MIGIRSARAVIFILAVGWIADPQAHGGKETKVRLTGCLARGQNGGFVLNGALPMMSLHEQQMSNPMESMGLPPEPKTYELIVAAKGVTFVDHVGHRVDVTGLIKNDSHEGAGTSRPDIMTSGRNTHNGQHGSPSASSEHPAQAQLKVLSIAHMAPTCS